MLDLSYVPTAADAFAIADEAMAELLRGEALALTQDTFGLVNDAQQEVSELAQASPAVQQAVTWLHARGFLQISRDGHGMTVRLVTEPPSTYPAPSASTPASKDHP